MRRFLIILLAIAILMPCTSCSKNSAQPRDIEPQIGQVKYICELAVMECYYHNVAKYYEKDATNGFLGIGKKDKVFWIEYSGIVKLGIDASLVNIDVNGEKITITMPEAKVLSYSFDADSAAYYVDKDSAKVTGEDEVKALGEAQAHLLETASNDKTLLENAQARAMALVEGYISNIGNAVDKQYSITWIILDAEGNQIGISNSEITEPSDSIAE